MRPYDTPNFKAAKKQYAGHPCSRCSAPAYTVDHRVPVKGSTSEVYDDPSNFRPMCARCNSALGGHMNKGKRKRRRRWRNTAYG